MYFKMKIEFHVAKAFVLLVIVKEVWMEAIVRHGVDGVIMSPGYPKYENNVNVTWMTYAPIDAISLSVTFDDFDLFQDSPCQDFLQIKQVLNSSVVFHSCGTLSKTNYIVIGNKMEVTFVTDGANTAKGFKMLWKVRDYKKEGKDPIVVIHSCPQTSSVPSSVLSTVEPSVNQSKCFETLSWFRTSEMSFVKDAIISVLLLALTGITTLFCCQRKKRILESKPEFNSTSALLTENNFISFLPEDTLRSTTPSGYAIPRDGARDNIKCETCHQDSADCGYMNTGSVLRPASYIDVHDLEQEPMKLQQTQYMNLQLNVGHLKCTNSKGRHVESGKQADDVPKHHSYIEVIGDGEAAPSSDSLTISGYSKPSQDVMNQISEILKKTLNLTERKIQSDNKTQSIKLN